MIQIINISLIPSDNKPVINVSQFDNISRVLRFNVFDDVEMEVPHVFDNTETVLLNIRKNDNNIVVITGVIVSDIDPETQEVTGQYITFELTEQACACVGSNYGEVSITRGSDEVIGSCNFKLIVERSPLTGGVSSQTAIDNLTTQVEEITEQVIGENYYDKEEINGLIDGVEESIPTKTSQLDNDSGFITASDIPTIPTKTSQLTNDSGFTTIDDSVTVSDKTWSSDKICEEIINILPVVTVSGNIANFETDLLLTLKSAVVNIPVDLNGIDKINIYQFGKNWFDITTETSGYYLSNTGEIFSSSAWCCSDFIPIKANETYTFYTGTASGASPCHCFYDIDKNFISSIPTANLSLTFTVPDNACFVRLSYRASSENVQLELGSSASSFESYINNFYSVTFNESIEDGAEIDLLTGEVKINTQPPTYDNITPLNINTFKGDNNIYSDIGEISVSYKDTIQHYIDTRIQAASNRTLSLMRSSETIEPIERGENNDDNAR